MPGVRGGQPAEIDVLVISPRTTPGLRRDHDELLDSLHQLGLTTAVATSNWGLLGRLRGFAYVLDELVVFAGIWHATRRAVRRVHPRAILITTSVAGALLPSRLLERAGIRFDGLAAVTRRQWWAAPGRALERRCLTRCRVLLPYTGAIAQEADNLLDLNKPCIVWPSPVRPGPEPARQRRPAGLCYANDPEKKGLDIAVAAWQMAAPTSHRLFVAGIEPEVGQRFLRAKGIPMPSNLEWCGRLPEADYRRLSASVLVYLGTSRVDEFATTQLEALADGALLVTGPSRGPVDALSLARTLEPRLVAGEMTVQAIAGALHEALKLPAEDQATYRQRARQFLEPYSRRAFSDRLRDEVLPMLRPPSSRAGAA